MNGCYRSLSVMFSVPVGSWYANLGYSDNRNEGRYVSRRELPNSDDRRDDGLPWESVYMTRSRSQAWQAGLSNAFSTRGLNINSSINLFMRNDHSGDGKDKGGFLSVSLSLAHNRQGDASSYTSVGATWQQQKHEKNQLNYNVAHNWYTDARGENEYGLNASGINSDSLNTSAYTRQGGRFGNGSLTVSDSWDRQDHRHRFSSSGNYSSTLALSRSGLWFGRWGDGRPASAIAVNVATPEASPDSRIAVSLDNSGSADIPANARALFALPGYQQTTLTINESTDISHGANSEITQGSGSRTVFMVPGKMLHREVQTTTRYTWLGQLTDEQHTPFIGGMPLNVSGWSDLGNGGFSAESDSLIQSLYMVKQQQFYQCALKVKTFGRMRSGSRVSAVMVPSSSIPVKEKIAIWKPAKKPVTPCGIKAVGSVIWPNEAFTPSGEVQPIAIIHAPVKISAIMVMTLISANQNSASPNIFTDSKLNKNRIPSVLSAGIHADISGNQYCI